MMILSHCDECERVEWRSNYPLTGTSVSFLGIGEELMGSVCATMRLDEEVLRSETGSISFEFRSRSDGNLFALRGADGVCLDMRIVGSSLVYEATVPDGWNKLEAEDVRSLDDGRWHSAAVTVSPAGTRLYLDGYQVFCGTTTAFLKDLPGLTEVVLGQGDSPEVASFTVHPEVLTSQQVMALSRRLTRDTLVGSGF